MSLPEVFVVDGARTPFLKSRNTPGPFAAADLAVAAALVSAMADRPLPDRSVWLGEVSLAGEIRPVAYAGLRLREAAKLGFATGYGPAGSVNDTALAFSGLRQLANLVDRVMVRA